MAAVITSTAADRAHRYIGGSSTIPPALGLGRRAAQILLRLREFGNDGTVQIVQVRRTLDRTHKSVVIDLFAWKAIDQIAITTETRTQGRYTVHGSGATRTAAR